MTSRETDQDKSKDGWSYACRDFPACSCGRPGCPVSHHAVQIAPHYSEQDPNRARIKPLLSPYEPRIGALALDVLNRRVGTFVARGVGKAVYLRGETGYEWETDNRYLERPSSALGELRQLSGREENL